MHLNMYANLSEHVLERFDALCTQGEANPILEGNFFLQLLGQAMIGAEQGPAWKLLFTT